MNKQFIIKSLVLFAMIGGQCLYGSEEEGKCTTEGLHKATRDLLFDDKSVIVYPIAYEPTSKLFLPTLTGEYYTFTGGMLEKQKLTEKSPVFFTHDVQQVLAVSKNSVLLQPFIDVYNKGTAKQVVFVFTTEGDELSSYKGKAMMEGMLISEPNQASLPDLFERFTKKSDEQGADSATVKHYACILEPRPTAWDRVKYLGFLLAGGIIIFCLFKRGFFDQCGTFLSRA